MKTFALQKRLAASVLKVGQNKVCFDNSRIDDIREAITKEDIKQLVKEKAIKKKPFKGTKRRAGKKRQKRKRKGRRRGVGKRKKIVNKRKKEYMVKIRKFRTYIRELKLNKNITAKESNILMKLAKAGMFRSKKEIKEKLKKK